MNDDVARRIILPIVMALPITTIDCPTPEDLARAAHAESPAAMLSEEDLLRYRGHLVALLMDGNDKGTVIAHVPPDGSGPEARRKVLLQHVADSAHSGRWYQVRQIPDDSA